MPVPIVNVMVVVLRNSLAPINRIITNVCMKGSAKATADNKPYLDNYGFIFFNKFGQVCYFGDQAMTRFVSASVPGGSADTGGSEK